MVVSQDHGEAVSTVSIYAAAGSRNETADTAGAGLHLRSLPFQVRFFFPDKNWKSTNSLGILSITITHAHAFSLHISI